MLVLSRFKGEKILIGREIEIVVVDIRHDKVRIGINAPQNVAVHREEVFKQIEERMAQGVPLHKIEEQLDIEDNRHA